jgi:hypothetical protein
VKTPTAILLGGNKLNLGVFDKFKAGGLQVIVVDWNAAPELPGDRVLRIDVKDSRRVLEALVQIGGLDVQVAYTSIDVAVPTAVAIHRHYGLAAPHGPSFEAPLSKAGMTRAWREAGLLNRFSLLLAAGDEPALQQAACGREVIVKPNLSSSSRGITILPPGASADSLGAALRLAERVSFDGQAIVEEFFPGREFTVEMLGDGQGNVSVYAISVKYHTRNAGPNRVANKLHYNSAVYPDAAYERIAEYARRCYSSLGLYCSLGHLEILMREDGLLSPVEIGARSSGLIVTPLAEIASERDFLGDYLAVLHGGRVDTVFHRSSMSSMYFFYDFPPGRPCVRATHLGEHLPPGVELLYHDRAAIARGRVYCTIDNDTERHGYAILRGRRDVLTFEAVAEAERRMLAMMFDGADL